MTMVCWEVVLSKGQEWDWFNDAFGRVQILSALFLVGGNQLGGLGNAPFESHRQLPAFIGPQLCPVLLLSFSAHSACFMGAAPFYPHFWSRFLVMTRFTPG